MLSDFIDDYPVSGFNAGDGDNSPSGKDENMLSNENLLGFITDSPFSFRNPIFFSVPRDNNFKDAKPIASRRQLIRRSFANPMSISASRTLQKQLSSNIRQCARQTGEDIHALCSPSPQAIHVIANLLFDYVMA